MAVQHTRRMRWAWLSSSLIAVLLLASCSGPAEFTDSPPATTPTVTTTPTATEEPDTTPTVDDDSTPTAEIEGSTTPDTDVTPEVTPLPTSEPTPEPEETPTEEPEPSPTAEPVSAMEALPRLEELSEGGYVVADQGDRTAEQLAVAYADSAAHLLRLEDWGFQQHVFREFTRNETGPDDALPSYVLATVNVYGSVEQADLALQWLEDFQTSQGASLTDAPDVGDAAIALTVATAQGEQTASVYVRHGDRIFIYYAQGKEPLAEVVAIAERVFERLGNLGRIASPSWQITTM